MNLPPSVATLLLTAILLGACTTPADEPTPEATPTSTTTTSPTPSPTSPPTEQQPPAPTPTSDPAPALTITGLFSDPRPRDPDTVAQLVPRPASTLPEHDSHSVVLYDTQLNTTRVFGPGQMGVFSPDSRYLVWQEWPEDRDEPATLRVINLQTGDIRGLGTRRGVRRFEDERHVEISAPHSLLVQLLVDVVTGERKPINSTDEKSTPNPSGRYRLEVLHDRDARLLIVSDPATALTVLRVDALHGSFASDHELVALIDAGEGIANIFLINLDTRAATFVATAPTEPFAFSSIPLAANSDYVVWTPNFCDINVYATLPADGRGSNGERRPGSSPQRGNTTIYNRHTDTVTELSDASFWIATITPDGRLVDGGFGGDALIDPRTLTWDIVLPPGTTDVNWSPDYRYASRGEQIGHGGLCPTP